jgi:hypothetical protein
MKVHMLISMTSSFGKELKKRYSYRQKKSKEKEPRLWFFFWSG